MQQILTDPSFWKSVGMAAVLLIVGTIIHFASKKPTRSELLFNCHKDFIELEKELKTLQFIDVDLWGDRIWVFKMKWINRVDNDILTGYVDQLKLYTRQVPLAKDNGNTLTG
ncbi:MAG TPA: hypothetical protein VMZ03_04000 [Chitinophagaceae bacterium]|nr:hypothetical protein [Chitinophagaceae bacterium]